MPVQISFTEQSLDADAPKNLDRALLKAYFDLFLDLHPRWKTARFWAPYVPWESFEDKWFPPAPLLESVVLEGPSDFDIPAVGKIISVCWHISRKFRKFELIQHNEGTTFSGVPNNPCPPLPIAAVTTLRLDCKIIVRYCCDILAAARNLKECSFSNVAASDGCVNVPFESRSLRTLKIGVNFEDHDEGSPTYLWKLFEFLRAPALRHLSIKCDDFWSTEHFTAFIRRSMCCIEALDFFMVAMTEAELIQTLKYAPFLRILKIHGDLSKGPQPVKNEMMSSLTRCPENVDLLCPRLEMFVINEDAVACLQDGVISSMLSSRVRTPCIEYFWFEARHDNEQHKLDIEILSRMTDERETLKNVVIGISADSQDAWDIAVEQKLAEKALQ